MTAETPKTAVVPVELLPCPFCGGKAHLLTGMVEFIDVEITCTKCSATGGNENEGSTQAENARKAAAAWNTRPLANRDPQAGEAVAWRYRPTGADGWIHAGLDGADVVKAMQDRPNLYEVQPLYASPQDDRMGGAK